MTTKINISFNNVKGHVIKDDAGQVVDIVMEVTERQIHRFQKQFELVGISSEESCSTFIL